MTDPIQPQQVPNIPQTPAPPQQPTVPAAAVPQAPAPQQSVPMPPAPPVPVPPQQAAAQVPYQQTVPTGGIPQVPVPPQSGGKKHGDGKGKKPFWKSKVFWIVVAVLVVVCCVFGATGNDTDSSASSKATSSQAATPKKAKPKTESKVKDMEGDVDNNQYHVKLDSVVKATPDYEGKPTAVLTYELTNNKTENSNPIDLNLQVFQNGHQLQTAVYTQTPDGYDVNSYASALQPGATGTVTLGYVLEDETNPVTVEVSGTVDASGQKVTHKFALQ